MKNLEFFNPVKMVCGDSVIENKLALSAKNIGIKKAMVISGPIINKLGITDFVANSLEAGGVVTSCKWTNVPNESSLQCVREICRAYTENDCDGIVAVGGGSVLDTAKAAKLLLSQGKQDLQGLFGYDMAKAGVKIPFIAIPTTCGTGSEATKVAVILDEKSGRKEEILSEILLPDIAMLDPKMIETLPQKSVLLTAFDALAHAIEGYCGKGKNAFSDEFSILAIKLILSGLQNVLGDNPSARGRCDLLKGAYYAGVSFSNSMVGAVHAIAHSAGSVLNVAHDFAVANLLPYVLKFNLDCSQKEYAKLYTILSPKEKTEGLDEVQKAQKFVNEIREIYLNYASKIRGICKFKECVTDKNQYEEIAKLTLSDGAILTNAKFMSYNDIITVLQMTEEERL